MKDLRYIFGSPTDVGIGLLYPIGILDYSLNIDCFNILNVTKDLLLQKIDVKEKEIRGKIKKEIKNFDVLIGETSLFPQVQKLLSLCFKIKEEKIQKIIYKNEVMITLNYEKTLENQIEEINKKEKKTIEDINIIKNNQNILLAKVITRENYDHIRNEIIKINNIRLPKQANNAELQKWFDRDYKMKHNVKNGNANIDTEDIIVGIMSVVGYTPKEMSEMTIYQINKIIEKIKSREEFEMNIKFICAGGKDIKLKSWLEHIDEAKMNENSSNLNDFMQHANALLKSN